MIYYYYIINYDIFCDNDILFWLVVSTPVKNMKVSWDIVGIIIPNDSQLFFQTTNRILMWSWYIII